MNQLEGNRDVPFFFSMNNETQTQHISGMVAALLENDPGDFLVELKITPGNHIKIFIDNDTGMTIEKCVAVNRALYKKLEESNTFPDGDFSLEVSSPGLDEPLKIHRQYIKNLGRTVEITMNDDTQVEGRLLSASEGSIEIEEKKGKKKELVNHILLLKNIKTTKIKVVF